MREGITAPNAAPRHQYHSRSQAWKSAFLQGSESSRMCAFMQALMRPCPGATSLQNCLISGLHALAAAIAPDRICAIAPDAESNKMAQMVKTRISIVPLLSLLEEWSVGSFAKDPPNATVSVLSEDGTSVRDAVVELREPHLDGDKLTFEVPVLEGDLAGADGPASVFVDITGCRSRRCPTPVSRAARPAARIGTGQPQPRRHTITRLTGTRHLIIPIPTLLPTDILNVHRNSCANMPPQNNGSAQIALGRA
jgi:hypothetical protein